MLAKLDEFRAALAALVVGLVSAALGQLIPQVRDALGPEAVNVVSALLAAGAAALPEDRVDGWGTREAARWLRDELTATPPDDPAGPPADDPATNPEGRS